MIRSSWKCYHGSVFGHGCHHKFRKSCVCVSGSRNSWRNFYHCGIGKIGNILLITQDFVDKFILFQRSNGSSKNFAGSAAVAEACSLQVLLLYPRPGGH